MNAHSSFIAQSFKASFAAEDSSLLMPSNKTNDVTKDLLAPSDSWLKSVDKSELQVSAGFFGAQNQSLGGPIPSLDETEASQVAPNFNLTNASMMNLPPALSKLDLHPDPFSQDVQLRLLSDLTRPVNVRHGYKRLAGRVPNIKPNSVVSVADVEFLIMECKGEGGFGKVFKALKRDDGASQNETIANIDVVLKLQKPPREWEFYICTELHHRLLNSGTPSDCDWFMSIPRCYTYDDGSIFVSEHQSNTLLDICNQVASLKATDVEPIAIYFTIEMLKIAQILQKASIIHADIKPENFLVQRMASIDANATDASTMFKTCKPSLQMIDFGVSIDLALFAAGTTFSNCSDKAENRTPDMLEGRPWTFQVDCFGIASVAYTLLNGSYMKLIKNKNCTYSPNGSMKRWWNSELWMRFFHTMLNIESTSSLPDLAEFQSEFEKFFFDKYRTKFMSAVGNLSSLCAKGRH